MTTTANPLVTSVSAFFPCYNDALSIGKMVSDVHRGLDGLVDDFEVIVVNDGSSDDSLDVLRGLQTEFPRLRIVNHEKNRGYGGALLSGFAASTKEWVLTPMATPSTTHPRSSGASMPFALTPMWCRVTRSAEVIRGIAR